MNWSPVVGAAQVAIGRAEGIARFGDTPQAFLASLAPLVAFPLVGAAALLMQGNLADAATTLLLTVVAQLAPAVLSHALAVRWGREAEWLRYATAFNWCQWAIPLVFLLLLFTMQVARLPDGVGGNLVVLVLACYGIWLHWTLARHGLRLSRGLAALLVVLVNAGTVLLVVGPHFVQGALNGSSG